MTEHGHRPRRADASDADEESASHSLAPRRAAAAVDDDTATGTAAESGSWRVVGVVGIVLLAVVILFYFLFGRIPSDDRTGEPTSSPSVQASPTSTPTPSPSYSGTPEQIGDASVTMPDNWSIYADEVTEGDRRLIRARADGTTLRLQVATLTTVGTDLVTACQALVDDQSTEYDVEFQISPSDISVEGEAVGVTCGYVGTRSDQQEQTSVLFTMIQRGSDLSTLVVRTMQPTEADTSSREYQQLASLTCEAASTFGHALPLCPNYSP